MSTHGIAWFPQYINYDSFRTLRDDWNTNCIRLAMYTAEYGGYCTGGDKEQLKQLDRYAQALGLAFQVRDDMLDVISSDQELGKPVGSDRANEKSTFVNALGLENCAQLVEELSQQAAAALAEFEQPEFLVWLAHALAERKQ